MKAHENAREGGVEDDARPASPGAVPLRRKVLFSVVVFVALAVLGEGAARLIEFWKPDPYAWHRGLSLPPKPPDSFRIFLYGGSTVEGAPLPDYGFARQLEFWLRQAEPRKRLELRNFGAAGQASPYVREAVERTIDGAPDLIIVMTGHNEFLARQTGLLSDSSQHLALVRVAMRVRDFVRSQRSGGVARDIVTPPPLVPWVRESEDFRGRVNAHVENLHAIARIARDRRVPLMLVTAPSNQKDWPPVFRNLAPGDHRDTDYEGTMASALASLDAGEVDKLEQDLEQIERSYPGDAMSLYLRGSVCLARGDREQARRLFASAVDADPIPWRALSEINGTSRSIAREENAILVDAEAAMEQEAEDGIVGFTEIADNCHPTPLGGAIIARAIMAAMASRGLFVEHAPGSRTAREQLERYLAESFEPERIKQLDKAWFLHCAVYAMKTPFRNLTASKRYLERAAALDPSDWVIWANLAAVSLFQGHVEQGAEQLRQAVSLRGEPIDSTERSRIPCLPEALERLTVPVNGVQ